MQAALHGRQTQPQQRSRLPARQPFEVAQRDDLALRLGQTGERCGQVIVLFVLDGDVFGCRPTPPGPDAEFADALDGSGIDWLAPGTTTLSERGVAGDGEQPGAHARLAAKPAHTLPGRQERLLQDVFSLFGRTCQQPREAEYAVLMAADQAAKGVALTFSRQAHQRQVV